MSGQTSELILAEMSQIIMAGAGAGKTTRLVSHIVENFLSFKEKNGRWPRIVGTTFTRKSANEIQERVSNMYQKYKDDEILDFAYSDYLNIGTIHSICLQLLRKKAYLLGYPLGLEIAPSSIFKSYKKKIVLNFLKNSYFHLLEDFSLEKILDVIDYIDSNKEYQFIPASFDDHKKLLIEDISKNQILFSQKLSQIQVEDLGGIKKSEEGLLYLKDLDQSLKSCLAKSSYFDLKGFIEERSFTKPSKKLEVPEKNFIWQELWKLRDDCKEIAKKYNNFYNEANYLKLEAFAKDFLALYQDYNLQISSYKMERAQIEMSDVEFLCLKLLKEHKDECQDFILQWDYWYIDEYQDTSEIQSQIFNILLENKNYFKVGDPQQSIYLFRGAQSTIFNNEFRDAEELENVKKEFLDINYRSEKNLLLGINELFKTIDSKNFREMKPHSDVESEKKNIQIVQLVDSEEELNFIVKDIQRKVSEGVLPNEICILGRTKKILYKFEDELYKNKIAALTLVAGSLSKRPEIKELLLLLNFLDNPNENEVLLSLLRTDVFRMEASELQCLFEEYTENKESWSLWSFIIEKEIDALPFRQLKELQFIYKNQGPLQTLKCFLINSGYLDLAKNEIDLSRRRSNIMKLYMELSQSFKKSNYNFKNFYNEFIGVYNDNQASEALFEASNSGVKLMTIHGSKGLEFDHVYVVGCSQQNGLTYFEDLEKEFETGRFVVPYKDRELNERIGSLLQQKVKDERVLQEKSEALRLIYVAVTRAKKELCLVGLKTAKQNSIFSSLNLKESPNFNFIHLEDMDIENKDTAQKNAKTKKEDINLLEGIWQFKDFESEHYFLTEERLKPNNLMRDVELDPVYSVSRLVDQMQEQNLELNYDIVKKIEFDIQGAVLNHKTAYDPILFGEIFHKALELFVKGLSIERIQSKLKETYLGDLSFLTKIIESLAKSKDINFSRIIKNAKAEWGFNSLLNQKYLISGQIDLWGEDEEGKLHVFDYKTGNSKYLAKACFQLMLYKMVLSSLYPEREILTHIIYLSEGKMFTICINNSDQIFRDFKI